MVKQFLLATSLLFSTAAFAQSFPKPPDVPTPSIISPIYTTNGTQNVAINPTITAPPYYSTMPSNIPVSTSVGKVFTNGPFDGTVSPYCLTIAYGGTCSENKFRTRVDFGFMLPDDPIRNYGQPGSSHLHCFFGNGTTNANSTYNTLRKHSLTSTAAGKDINGTAYWFPCMVKLNPFGDGKNYALRPDYLVVYYTENPATTTPKADIARGTRYVTGFDMDATSFATQYAWLQTILDTANTTIGHTRYALTNPGGGLPGNVLYNCTGATPTSVTVIKKTDGSDPFSGTCNGAAFTGSISGTVLTVTAVSQGTLAVGEQLSGNGISPLVYTISSLGTGTGGTGTYNLSGSATITSEAMGASQDFFAELGANSCWDGVNPWTPGGYKNVIPKIWDGDNSKFVCPTNFYLIPALVIQFHWTQYGWADRQTWDLSSDISYRASHSLTQATFAPGLSFHTDWFGAWDDTFMQEWEHNGIGTMGNTGHELNASQINDHQGILDTVDVSGLAHVNATDPGYMLIPTAWSGSLTAMHIHH